MPWTDPSTYESLQGPSLLLSTQAGLLMALINGIGGNEENKTPTESGTLVEVFEGRADVVKGFVWRKGIRYVSTPLGLQ